MATNGKSNIEVTADTRKARKTMGDFFRDIENSGRRFNQVLNSLDPFNDLQRDAVRTSREMDELRDAARRLDSGLDNLGDGNNLDDLTRDLDTADRNMDDLEASTSNVDAALNNARREVEDFGDASVRESREAEGSFGRLGETAKRIGGVLIAAFAVDKIKDFATDLAATAGSAQAVKAQFSTVFGDMESEAAERLGAIAGEASILENRMKESFAKIAAFAKTGGMDTADSLNLADRSMRAIADSAAFYDKSLEDTTESLQSFLKGNFENDAALGLSATETTRNAAANDLYGKSFKDLSESQKQLTLLQMVEDANKVSGAFGQAARESDGWENVTGNMKQAWTDFKAVIGEPFLDVAVTGLKNMTALVSGLDTEAIRDNIGGAFKFVGGIVGTVKDKVGEFVDAFGALRDFLKGDESAESILSSFGVNPEEFSDTIQMANIMKEALSKVWDSFKDGKTYVDAVFALFKNEDGTAISLLHQMGLKPEEIQPIMDAVHEVQAVFEDFGERIKTALSPAKEAIEGVFALFLNMDGTAISIFHALGLNPEEIQKIMDAVDDIKQSFSDLWSELIDLAKTHGGNMAQYWTLIIDTAVAVFKLLMPYIKPALEAVFVFVSGIAKKISDFWKSDGEQLMQAIGNVFKGILAVIEFIMPLVLGIIKIVWGNIKGVISGALNVIMGIVKIFSGLFTGDFKKMWEGLVQVFKGAVEFIWNFIQLTFYGKILGGAKAFILTFRTFFVNLWAGIVQLFKGNATNALNIIKGAWSAISASTRSVFNSIWQFFRDIFMFIKNVITGAVSLYFKIIFTTWSSIFNVTKNVFTNVWNFFKSIFTTIRNFISGSASGIFNKIRDTWSALKNNTTGAFRDIFNGIKTKFTDIVNLAKGLPKRIGDGIGAMASKVTSGVTKVINKLASTLGKGVNGVIGGVNWVLGKIGVDTDIPKWSVPQYAQGTKDHPGGLAIVGDGKGRNSGSELIQTPDGKLSLSPDKDTVVNLPKGSKVLSALKTKDFLASLPKYANGIGNLWDKTKKGATHLWDKAKDTGKKVINKAFDIFDYIKNPSKLLDVALSTLGISKPGGTGFTSDMAKGTWNKVKSRAVNFVKGKLADFGDNKGLGFGAAFRKTSSYGWRTHPITKKRELHRGDDYGAAPGTRIPAQAAGRVIQAAYHALRGNYVRIKSGIMERIYQHNARNLVGVGDTVRKGQAVGTVGSTGASTGPHLHYEVLKNGGAINPAGFFKGGIVKMKQLAWIAEKGMEAIIPLETNRAEGLDLWRKVGEHFGFNMDALMNPDAFNVNFAGNGMEQMQSMSAAGSKITKAFQPAATSSTQAKQPVIIQTVLPNGRIMAEEYIDDFNAEDQRRKKMKKPNKGGRVS
ncbi:peptidoglycan DD-metalloendopeptidase family protein [Planococcus halotolerans]|uniref:M23ase beta-sheet core domain-containing protein n=1 Tax=Planococcus halotolerans TaxID=2233542 RepID=A0A365KKH3_9BACL|nr:peptidoglycan DD-metalloendopeptidase family protein [Planococcus halotolerans]RAZ73633.1 hypothetical protein DP120_17000 [Planococcus halotolerans]